MAKLTDIAEVENTAEGADSITATETTDQTATATAAGSSTVEKTDSDAKAANPYKEQLDRLEKENRQKAGALEEERRRRKEAEARLKDEEVPDEDDTKPKRKTLSPEDAERMVNEKLAQKEFETLLKQVSDNPDEQELVKRHYNESIKRTGNVVDDLKKAVAIANQHLVEKSKREQMEREQAEAQMAGFSGSRTYGKTGLSVVETNPTLKSAAALLRNWGDEDSINFLGK